MAGARRLNTIPLLSKAAAQVLTSFALSNVLLAFDYDGTLAPITRTPARARLRASTKALLQRVALAYPTVVVSGRALADVTRRLERIPLWYVFGNHGSEPASRPALLHRTREWLRALSGALPSDPGIFIENKGHSLTVHYRDAHDRGTAREAIVRVAASLPGVRIVGGRDAVNLLQRDAPNKGSALSYALRAFACDTAIYVGDDDTDEDAFAALPSDRLLPVMVGQRHQQTHARFHLESQREIDLLLKRLLALRTHRPGRGDNPRLAFKP